MKMIMANWKMNGDTIFAKNYVEKLNRICSKHNVVICPPTILMHLFENLKSTYSLGAQNCFYEQKGAFTGELSIEILKEYNCKYVICGHSERRKIFNENNEIIFKKAKAILENNLIPVVCIGETKEERSDWRAILKEQLELIKQLNNNDKAIVVAYEPIWSIGTGETPSSDEINESLLFIKKELRNNNVAYLYGGSVTKKNAHNVLNLQNVDGLLIGGASLKIDEFIEIISIQ